MDYPKLDIALQKIGRDRTWAYVSDGFKPELRRDPKFRQWQRVSQRVAILAMDPELRRLMNRAAAIRIAATLDDRSPTPLGETPFGRELARAA
jgi:hypothetical protein